MSYLTKIFLNNHIHYRSIH